MKYLFIFFTAFTSTLQAQSVLKFDNRFVESEDKWVAFQKGKDSTYIYGFIYIDPHAGLTLNYEGNFTISDIGTFIPKKIDSADFKIRLQANQVRVAFIPENKFKELRIPVTPEWLKYYKGTDTGSVQRLYRWGYLYNSWNECAKALTYLERAQNINPNFKGLSVELAFSYNCLKKFDRAISILQNALETNPTDAYINKELIYAQIKSEQLDKAAESCKRAIEICTDNTYNGENCYNLLNSYYAKKDRISFNRWLAEANKWTSTNTTLSSNIKLMVAELAK